MHGMKALLVLLMAAMPATSVFAAAPGKDKEKSTPQVAEHAMRPSPKQAEAEAMKSIRSSTITSAGSSAHGVIRFTRWVVTRPCGCKPPTPSRSSRT